MGVRIFAIVVDQFRVNLFIRGNRLDLFKFKVKVVFIIRLAARESVKKIGVFSIFYSRIVLFGCLATSKALACHRLVIPDATISARLILDKRVFLVVPHF